MFTKTTISCLALFFLLSTNLFHGAAICFLYPKVHLTFYNHLPTKHPDRPLLVQCKSKDDNLGNHTLMHGQTWGFSFCSIPLKTLFTCKLHWSGRNMAIVAYDGSWVLKRCNWGKCTWTVTASGASLQHGEFHYWGQNPSPRSGSILYN
ncbi:hypothetical protein PHJA_001591200 [Phtheirospermum japonicum]|uniref:S-protein homolog n=1 Tax=Phtheirospermum japonicum TaxID=374723 RepID=A0A830CBR1_9LAMI|nr:hypothetical protein PHJA_001591200 [Phtheirospermum japonicum]